MRTDPMRKHMLEIEKKMLRKIQGLCMLSHSMHDILFLFVKQMWETQFSYSVSFYPDDYFQKGCSE